MWCKGQNSSWGMYRETAIEQERWNDLKVREAVLRSSSMAVAITCIRQNLTFTAKTGTHEILYHQPWYCLQSFSNGNASLAVHFHCAGEGHCSQRIYRYSTCASCDPIIILSENHQRLEDIQV